MSIITIPGGGGGGNDSRLHVSDAQPDSSIVTEGDLWSRTTSNELFRATDSSTFVSVETTGSGSMTTVEEEGVQVGGADIILLNFKAGFDITEPVNTEIDIDLDFTEVTVNPATLILPNGAAPTPTTEADMQWETDRDSIVVGDGAGQKFFHPVVDATSDPLVDADAASDGTEATVARKDHQHIKHHAKYLDSEAIAAVEGEATLDLAGDVTIDGAKSLSVDVINEKDAAAGVTVDGLLIKDSAIPEAAVTGHEAAIDHDALTNFVAGEHQLEAAIDHDALTNFVAAEHVLEASIDHDALTNFVAAEHHTNNAGISFIIDGGGSAITTGIKGDVEIPFTGTITAVRMLADQSGSIVVDIWKDTYANLPPTDADSITASAVPTISTAVKSEDATLTGWTTAVTKGDWLRYNVDSITTVERVTISLSIDKT